MATVPGVVDLSVEQQIDIPMLRVHFDRAAIARHGLTIGDVAHTLEAALQGVTVSRVLEGRNAFDLVARLSDGASWTPETMATLLVDTPGGAKIPLQRLAQVTETTGPEPDQPGARGAEDRRHVQRRRPRHDGRGAGHRPTGRPAHRRQARLYGRVWRPVRECRGGEPAPQPPGPRRGPRHRLPPVPGLRLGPRCRPRHGEPAAGAHRRRRRASSCPAACSRSRRSIGFITVFGIATRNGIMLVSHIRHLQEHEGVTDFGEAVCAARWSGSRPILMTALAAGLALIPLALGGDKPGNEIQTPMAIVILCGLLTSMVLNMLVVPALYLRFGRPVQRPPVPAPSAQGVMDQTAADR